MSSSKNRSVDDFYTEPMFIRFTKRQMEVIQRKARQAHIAPTVLVRCTALRHLVDGDVDADGAADGSEGGTTE
jgi:hypothetical protein